MPVESKPPNLVSYATTVQQSPYAALVELLEQFANWANRNHVPTNAWGWLWRGWEIDWYDYTDEFVSGTARLVVTRGGRAGEAYGWTISGITLLHVWTPDRMHRAIAHYVANAGVSWS